MSTVDQRVLRLLGHVKKIEDYRMAKRVLMAKVSGVRTARVRLDGSRYMRLK